MKKLMLIGLVGLILASCNTRTGHLTGVLVRPMYYPEIPLGMVYVPSGAYNMGENDQDVPFLHQTVAKTVSVQAFYMDQTEISNNEYRQFVQWVRDSIARDKIYVNEENRTSGYKNDEWSDDDAKAWINYQDLYFDEATMEFVEYDPSDRVLGREIFNLNWDRPINYEDPKLVPLLADMYYPQPERFFRRKEIDTRKLMYKYYWVDLIEAAKRGRVNITPDGYDNQGEKIVQEHRTLESPPHPYTKDPQGQDLDLGHFNKKGQNNAIRGHEDRSRFIIDEMINVYPDTLCWIRDFTYSFHD